VDSLAAAGACLVLGLGFGVLALRAARRDGRRRRRVAILAALLLATGWLVRGVLIADSLLRDLRPDNPRIVFRASGTRRIGNFVVSIVARGVNHSLIRVTHTAEPARVLWESVPGVAFLSAARTQVDVREFGTPEGSFRIRDRVLETCDQQSIDGFASVNDTLVVRGTLAGRGCDTGYRVIFTAASANQLRFQVRLDSATPTAFNRLTLRYASSADEHLFGFGQQLTFFGQKGNVLPILVQEHGVGRGLPVFTPLVNLTQNGGGGTPYVTEAPAPQYISSTLRSLFLENTEYSTFDMRAPDRIVITLYANTMTGRILYGRTPLDLIQEYTAYAGRMRPFPDWVYAGAIISVQGGTDRVLAKLRELTRAGVPVAAFWVQDWPGRRVTPVGSQLWWNWKLDTTVYPRWDELVDALQAQHVRMLLYINPFLTNAPGHDDLFTHADAAGYLVKKQDGTPYLIKNTNFSAGLVDLSNPAARTWMKQTIKDELIGRGRASGWMADFGEALPFDAVLHGGARAEEWHNRYPEAWAQINREAIAEAGRGSDIVFWSRSGFTQSPQYSTLFWLGDQLQTWDGYDGIKTAVVGMLSGGISGFSLLHSDTGGYNAFSVKLLGRTVPIMARSRELLMRWVELSAVTSVLRTHEGLDPSISAQIDSTPDVLAHFARLTRIYRALAFYRKVLVDEAARTGHPVVRALFLHYPNDPVTYTLTQEFMFGSEFIVSPVLNPGQTRVRVYLPAGTWVSIWTGATIGASHGLWTETDAPLGKPAVFYRQGSSIGERFVRNLDREGVR